jgi:transcriptional regulator with XRE-family HTH domain
LAPGAAARSDWFIFTGMNGKSDGNDGMDALATLERLKALRIKAGQDAEGLADQIGITAAWYLDLESQAGELEASLDLTQLRKLAILLNVGLGYLLTGATLPDTVPTLSFLELARRIRVRLEHSQDVKALEEKTGWDLGAFLKNPEADGWDQRTGFFRDVCAELELDWRGVLRYGESIREE